MITNRLRLEVLIAMVFWTLFAITAYPPYVALGGIWTLVVAVDRS